MCGWLQGSCSCASDLRVDWERSILFFLVMDPAPKSPLPQETQGNFMFHFCFVVLNCGEIVLPFRSRTSLYNVNSCVACAVILHINILIWYSYMYLLVGTSCTSLV
jgi:hypothetical protein